MAKEEQESLFLPLILGFIYVFDEQINFMFNNNSIGSFFFVVVTLIFFHRAVLSGSAAISLKLSALLVVSSIFSLLAYSSSLGCSVEFKGAFSMLLLWGVIISIQITPLAKIVTLKSVSNVVIILISAFVCLDALGVHLFVTRLNAGSFYEPSHLAMYALPFIAYRLLLSNRDLLSWIAVVVIILISPSSTFLVGLVGILVLWLIKGRHLSNSRGKFRIALAIAFLSILLASIDTSHTQERIKGIWEGGQGNVKANLSSLVWLNGWSQAYNYLVATRGLGVGFNQMGCEKFVNLGQFSSLMYTNLGVVLNSQDGSFMAAKLLTELGLFGLLLVIFLMAVSIKSIFNINRNYAGVDNAIALARAVGGMCLLSLLFVRCAGYFQLPVLLAISLLTLKLPNQASITNNNYG